MSRAAIIAFAAICAACSPVEQPESIRTVAAVEVPLKNAEDRRAFVAMLERHAAADSGLHVDDVSERWRKFEAHSKMLPESERGTIYVGVWRGADDNDNEADINDRGHPGRAWITFAKGRNPNLTARFRNDVLAEIDQNWPGSQRLPVLPSGGLPLREDLRLTTDGYRIEPVAASKYELEPASPLLARD